MSLQDKMTAAGNACAAGDFAAALPLFDEVLLEAAEESHGLLHFNRSVCLAQLGRPEDSEAALLLSVEADPGRAAAWFNLAVSASQRNDSELAMERVDTAITTSEEAEDAAQATAAKRLKCSLLKASGDLVGALELYSLVIQSAADAGEPVAADLHCSRAEVLCRQANWEEAVDDYEACMEAHGALVSEGDTSNFAVALLNVAMTHQAEGNAEDAKQRYTQCLAIKRMPNALNNLAVIHVRAGELSEAEPLFREAVTIDPSHRNALTALGTCIAQAGRFADAEPFLRRAVAAAREEADTEAEKVLVAQHAVACFKLKYLDEAKAGFERLKELDPESTQATNGLMLVQQSRDSGERSVKAPAPAAAPAPAPAAASASASSAGGVRAAAARFGGKPSVPSGKLTASTERPKPVGVRASVHSAIHVNEDGCDGIIAALRQLTKMPYPEGVDSSKREAYLSRFEFEEAFGMNKAAFYSKPKWKRKQLKQKLGLF
jgi:tetratricopeptide (TPR) repeat protein